MTVTKENFSISTDKEKIDIDFVYKFLSRSYWAESIPKETVIKSIDGSLCFGVVEDHKQVDFARIVTDKATFSYLADVFMDENYRGKVLSKLLIQVILEHPDLQGLRRILLATRDAHALYAQFGFALLTNTNRWMQIHHPDVYKS